MKDIMKYNDLTPEEEYVIVNKGTERPGSGEYNNFYEKGLYVCRRCLSPLYRSETKFKSGCGWPSFDEEIAGAVRRVPDVDGRRTEIVCEGCGGHLGHVFIGEGFTDKNTRHCVNSLSMKFLTEGEFGIGIFASGCFWGTEYFLAKVKGVYGTTCGFIGGHVEKPTYKQVCTGTTGHAEAVQVFYNPAEVSYEELAKIFFETHDPTQLNGQGPDLGTQYRSEVFYVNEEQKNIAEKLIKILKDKGLDVVTCVTLAPKFWDAEGYHQDYYDHKGTQPYCHFYVKKF
jgi:peptide methionine sulfoxide reductase msrA/msrB